MTLVIARILRAFLEDVDAPRYGMELMEATGLPSGTLYPALGKLEAKGWLNSAKEKIDSSVEGRPARRYFTLDKRAIEPARHEIALLTQQISLAKPSPAKSRRPGLAGGRL